MCEPLERRRALVKGTVQGVGFRPFVWRRARDFELVGWVKNGSCGVTFEIEGTKSQIDGFFGGFKASVPPLARIDSVEVNSLEPAMETSFVIRESTFVDRESTPVSPEVSTCGDCLIEFNDPNDRRYRFPFINCTNCGPRFTIIEDIPYDRPATTMKSFVMCEDCQREYDSPADRRFHAQPNACAECGPRVWFVDSGEGEDSFCNPQGTSDEAISRFRAAIAAGQIVGVKGVGGFHLACDAANATVVARLRELKGRSNKPLAVMVADLERAQSFVAASEMESQQLEGSERPIVLLQKRSETDSAAMLENVAPGNDFVGVMLPYSPLHHLLAQAWSQLVMTSGNVSDEPIVRTNIEARDRLRTIADCFLLHDREIHAVCDDSVVRNVDGVTLPIRRSRGYAPMPIRLCEVGPSVLAVGGEIKTAFCLTKNEYAYVSQHVGDMGNLETLDAMKRYVDHLSRLFRVKVEAVVADLHPEYLSSKWARELASSLNVPLLTVQHHFAHGVALLAESGCDRRNPVLACCFDGTGYGSDGAIWGGEFLIATDLGFERVAHLSYFSLPGGDASIKRPYRIALTLLKENGLPWDDSLPCVVASSSEERRLLRQQLTQEVNCVPCSSMGRLFDAVASLIGIRHEVSYEAQAAMELEALADRKVASVDAADYAFELGSSGSISCQSLVKNIVRDVRAAEHAALIAARFHHAVAHLVVEVCLKFRAERGINTVGLTGGVFQNAVLLKLVKNQLSDNDFEVLIHSVVPPNDGGLALGQAVVAQKLLKQHV